MKNLLACFLMISWHALPAQNIPTRFEQSNGRESPGYFEIIDWWKKLDERSGKVKLLTMGMTDAGLPLHLAVVSNHGDYNFTNIRKNNKRIILINNGIHPGEPDGIDASMLLAMDIVTNRYRLPDNIVLGIIPVYNIGGCLRRSKNFRVDQNGPDEKGFRGNSRNLNLNRDLIKCDARESRAFIEIFHMADPDVFIDNHVSNGADYQHVMTLLSSQHNKLGGKMGAYINREFDPALRRMMKEKDYDLIPYVNVDGDIPDKGWTAYWDSPRYSSGFASLWNTFAFLPETHMLKPFEQRVKATYALMQCFIRFTSENSDVIKQIREEANRDVKTMKNFPLWWKLDSSKYTPILFKGFGADYKTSEISGLPRLYYNRDKPFEATIPFYNHYEAASFVQKPKAYIIPQGWWEVIELLKLNQVQMTTLKKDTSIEVEAYHIDGYKAAGHKYEKHHLNSQVIVSSRILKMNFRKGDYYILMNQVANRFLMEVLEPQAEDSYFTWNFFDAILDQTEYYSDYVFEDIAAEYLKSNPSLKNLLEEKRKTDSSFAASGRAQLDFIFHQSPYFDPANGIYPVYRILE